MNRLAAFYRGRTVAVTGHTGLLGRWVLGLLAAAGAEPVGLSRATADVTDFPRVRDVLDGARPSVVLHLAAQSQARAGRPRETWAVNVLGTVNVLEAAAGAGVAACVVAGSSRDPARAAADGAVRDPYNASKLAAEQAVLDYRHRGLPAAVGRPAVLIGGGDPNAGRLVPSLLAALARGERPRVRTPSEHRPWQHAVEAAAGLLWLGAALAEGPAAGPVEGPAAGPVAGPVAAAYNFGLPPGTAPVPVGRLVQLLAGGRPGPPVEVGGAVEVGEGFGLDDVRARAELGWWSCWSLEQAVAATVQWSRGGTGEQVARYTADAARAGVRWALPAAQPCRTPQS